MAKVNPVKLKQEAEKLEKGGRPDQAIALYRQIADDNPRDWNVINKIGDLYAKLNRTKEAGDEYAKVADFYAKDGFLLKAIAIWKKINKLDASALEPYQNLAELYAKQGLMMEAKGQYQIVIDEFIKRGRTREAGETLRKMAEIDPADLKVRSKLADLYTREGSTEKAVGEHVAIAEELNKKGHLAEALQVLEKGLKIDPRSDRLRLELARVHLIQKNFDKAAQYLEEAVQRSHSDPQLLARLGEAYLGGRKIEEAEAIFKRLLELNPGDDDARAQMGRVYLLQDRFDDAFGELQPAVERMVSRREGDKAAALLQQITHRNPNHAMTLQKLAEVYRAFSKEGALATTLTQLTEALIAQHEFEPAAAALEELVRRDPQNQQHRNKLEFVKGKLAGASPARASTSAPSALDFEEEEFDLGQPSTPAPPRSARPAPAAPPRAAAAAPAPAAPAARARVPLEPSGPLTEEDREFIDEHVAEGRVFRKYGLLTKAIDQFEAVVARFPDHLEARQELREAYRDDNKPAKVADQCLALADIFRMKGDEAAAVAQEEEAQRLTPAPAPPPPAAAKAEPKPAKAGKAAAKAAPPPPPPVAPPISLDLEEEEEEEEIALDSEADEVPLSVGDDEEIALDTDDAPSGGAAEPSLLELDDNEAELGGGFLDDEPLAADTDLLSEPDLAPEPVAAAPPEPDFSAVEDEIELPDSDLGLSETPLLEQPEEITLQEDEEELEMPEPEEAPAPALEMADEFELPAVDAEPEEEPLPEPEPVDVDDPLGGMAADGEADVSLDFDEELPLVVDEPFPIAVPAFSVPEPEPPPPLLRPAARPEPPRAQPAARPAPPPVTAPVSPAMVRVLDEVDQYMALGFVDDARDALRELVARHPNHPAIMAKLDELGMELDGAEAAAAPAPAELADELLGGDVEVQLEGDADVELEAPGAEEAPAPLDEEPMEATAPADDDEFRFDEVSLDEPSLEEPSRDEPALDEPPVDEPALDMTSDDDISLEMPVEDEPFGEEPSREVAFEPEVEAEPEPEPEPEPEREEEPGLDLAAELDDLFSAQPAVEEPEPEAASSDLGDSGLAEIFKEFKKGVDKQLGQEDYDTRYNLGIAYKEMGLVDEAIAEFQLAAKDERRILECSSMLGICFLDKGMPKLAIKWFEKGLKAPGRSDEEYQGLRYDLASAYEAAGDLGTALGIFTELYGQDANFRDVAAKVRELRSQA